MAELEIDSSDWETTPECVRRGVTRLWDKFRRQEDEIARLREELARLRGETVPTSDQPASPSQPEPAAVAVPPPSSPRQRGGQPGHPGVTRTLYPPEQVTEPIIVVKPDCCAQCGAPFSADLVDPQPFRKQVVDLPPVTPIVTEYQVHTLTCPECDTSTRGTLPSGTPSGAFGPGVIALTAALCGQYGLSQRQCAELLADVAGIDLAPSTVPALEQLMSAALHDPVEAVRDALRRAPVRNADETGWAVGVGWKLAWLWVAVSPQMTMYLIRDHRDSQAAQALLGEPLHGQVGTDRWKAYNWIPALQRQICWSHLSRDFDTQIESGEEGVEIAAALQREGHRLFHRWHLWKDAKITRAQFEQVMAPVQHRVHRLLLQGAQSRAPGLAALCRDLLRLEVSLWTFVRVEGVEPTNNNAERAVRQAIPWRTRSIGTQSERGRVFVERILTTIATCRQQHRHVLAYLREAIQAYLCGQPAPSLVPAPANAL